MDRNSTTLPPLVTGSVRERMMRVGLRLVDSGPRSAACEPCIVVLPLAVAGAGPAIVLPPHLKQEPMS
jgi:hypothetical protein